MALYTDAQITESLVHLDGYSCKERTLVKEYAFNDFPAAIRWINAVAEIAETQQHHPDLLIQYNRVRLSVWTHDAGGLTEKDFRLAGAIEDIPSV